MSDMLPQAAGAQEAASQLLSQAKAHEVNDENVADSMTRLIEYADNQVKTLEKARTSLVKPLNDQVRFINGEFKKARETYEAASREGRAKLKPWLDKLAKEQREREEAERKATEEAARKLAEEQAAKEAAENEVSDGNEPPPFDEPPSNSRADLGFWPIDPPPPPPAPEPSPPARTPQGSKKKASTRKVKKWKITDMSKIPQKYFALDRSLVDAAMKDGEFIPGIEFYEDSEVVMR